MTTYQPTFMEKLLGRNYKWWFIANYYFRLQTAYRSDLFLFNFAGFLSFSVTIMIWFLVTRSDNPVIAANQILTYLFIGFAYMNIARTWYSQHLTRHILNGTLASQLISPTPVFWRGLFQFVGQVF